MLTSDVTTYYLEMCSPDALRPLAQPPGTALRQAEIPSPALNRFLYTTVGAAWQWTDRLGWDDACWLAYLERPEVETWLLYQRGTPAGYVELARQPGSEGDSVELAYFGLLPQFVGQGLGGYLLSAAVERAWAMGEGATDIERVWVHTCSLDHPHALANYRARGFQIVEESKTEFLRAAENPVRSA